jgi:hypothetical protein
MTDEERLAAEQRARVLIDRQLTEAGWVVQDRRELNLFAGQGVAVREVIMARGHGRADYLIYVDQKAVGVIEAKPAGTTLSRVEWQSSMYADGLPAEVRLKAVDHVALQKQDSNGGFEVPASLLSAESNSQPLPESDRFRDQPSQEG